VKPITLTADAALQKVAKFHDLNDGRFAVDTEFDVQDIVDHAERLRNAAPSGWKGDMHQVASIPMPIYMQLQAEWRAKGFGYAEKQAAMHAFLNDPANSKFRTKTGKV
jgi:hypothetical protein